MRIAIFMGFYLIAKSINIEIIDEKNILILILAIFFFLMDVIEFIFKLDEE